MRKKRIIYVIAAFVALSTAQARAKNDQAIANEFEEHIAKWKMQIDSAQSDIDFTNEVHRNFLITVRTSPEDDRADRVNTILAPLKARYFDYRLQYETENDFCNIQRAIQDARSAAYGRLSIGLEKQSRVLSLSSAYHSVLANKLRSDALGEDFTLADVENAFLYVMSEYVETLGEPEMGWGAMDSAPEPPPKPLHSDAPWMVCD